MSPYNPLSRQDPTRVAGVDEMPLKATVRACKGMNTFFDASEIADDEVTTGQNIDLQTPGKIMKTLGSNMVLNDPGGNKVVGLHYFNAPNVDERMIQIQGGSIYDSTLPLATSGSWTDRGGSVLLTADITTQSMIIADDKVFMTNRRNPVHYHNGAGIIACGNDDTDPPFGAVTAYTQNRLWIFNVYERGTAKGDIATYTATSGDMLKITVDGTAFDDIVMTGDTSIADAVASINAASGFSAKGLAWVDSAGYLRVSSLTVGETSTVVIADGTSGNGGECEDLFDGATVSVTGNQFPEYGYYSDALDTLTFNRSTNVFKVESGDATEVMAVVVAAGGQMVVFKETSVHEIVLQGPTASYWNLRQISEKSGCIAYNCAKENNGVIFYFAFDGLRRMGEPDPMSKRIQGTIDTINWDYARLAKMEVFKDRVYLAVPTGVSTYNNTLIIYDMMTDSFVTRTGLNVGCFGIYLEHTAGSANAFEEVLMYGDANDGKVYHLFKSTQFNDISAAIDMDIITKKYDFGEPDKYKEGKNFYLRIIQGPHADDDGITISYSIDSGAWVNLSTTTKASTAFSMAAIARWKTVQFRMRHNATSTQQVILNGWSVEIYPTDSEQ